jgi:O-antigen ligase
LRWLLTGSGLAWLSTGVGAATDLDVDVRPAAGGPLLEPESPEPALPFQGQPTRPELWRAGLALWAERPICGVGPDNFRRLYARKLGPHTLDDRVHANSLYVEVMATLGLLGALSLAGLVAALGVTGARALASSEPQARLVAAGALAGLLAFFVHGLVDYGLEASAVYGAFWLLAGLVSGIATGPTTPTK